MLRRPQTSLAGRRASQMAASCRTVWKMNSSIETDEPIRFLQAADHLDRRQRVATEIEERVVDADAVDPEHVLPDGDDQALGVGLGRRVARGELGRTLQRAAVRGLLNHATEPVADPFPGPRLEAPRWR